MGKTKRIDNCDNVLPLPCCTTNMFLHHIDSTKQPVPALASKYQTDVNEKKLKKKQARTQTEKIKSQLERKIN